MWAGLAFPLPAPGGLPARSLDSGPRSLDLRRAYESALRKPPADLDVDRRQLLREVLSHDRSHTRAKGAVGYQSRLEVLLVAVAHAPFEILGERFELGVVERIRVIVEQKGWHWSPHCGTT